MYVSVCTRIRCVRVYNIRVWYITATFIYFIYALMCCFVIKLLTLIQIKMYYIRI